jgi:hypothetical protein
MFNSRQETGGTRESVSCKVNIPPAGEVNWIFCSGKRDAESAGEFCALAAKATAMLAKIGHSFAVIGLKRLWERSGMKLLYGGALFRQ